MPRLLATFADYAISLLPGRTQCSGDGSSPLTEQPLSGSRVSGEVLHLGGQAQGSDSEVFEGRAQCVYLGPVRYGAEHSNLFHVGTSHLGAGRRVVGYEPITWH